MVKRVFYVFNYLWRLVGTGLAFFSLFFGGGFIAITILPILAIIPGNTRERAQLVIHYLFKLYIVMIQFLGTMTIQISDINKYKDCQGKILIANHPTLLDVVVLMSLIPRTQCIVKHQLWNHPLLGKLVQRAGYIRNDLPSETLLELCKQSLNDGMCLIIFPEGTRTTPGKTPKFQRGFAHMAMMTQAIITPVFIDCTPPTLIKHEPWWKIPPFKPILRLEIGENIDTKSFCLYPHNSLNVRKLVKFLELYYVRKIEDEQARRRIKNLNH